MEPNSPGLGLPVNWVEALAQVEESLARALADLTAREQALAAAPPGPEAGPPAAGQRALDRFNERLRGLAGCTGRARQTVAGVDAALAAGEEALQRWLAAGAGSGQQLADGGAGKVG